MEHDPHLLIEGCLIAAYAIRADACFVYIRGEYVFATRVLETGDRRGVRQGYAGKNILGSGCDCELRRPPRRRRLHLRRGDGADELARGEPRLPAPEAAVPGAVGSVRQPDDDQQRRDAAPTSRFIVERGADWFLSIGSRPKNTGPEALLPERPREAPRRLRGAAGASAPGADRRTSAAACSAHGRPLKAVIPGGSSVPVLTRRRVRRGPGLRLAGRGGHDAGLGRASWSWTTSTCMVQAIERIAHFYAHESCGQCTPCREGSGWMERSSPGSTPGEGARRTWRSLDRASRRTSRATRSARWPTPPRCPSLSFVKKFRDEFLHYIRTAAPPCRRMAGRDDDMPKLTIDGQEIEVPAGRRSSQAALLSGIGDPPLLLPPGALDRRQLPDLPGRGREGPQAR